MSAATRRGAPATANVQKRAMAQLENWRASGRTVYATFARDVASGAMTFVTMRGIVSACSETAITLKNDSAELRTLLDGAEFFDGPLTLIDHVAGTHEEADAVQIRLRGGDNLLIATRDVDERALLAASSLRRLRAAADE